MLKIILDIRKGKNYSVNDISFSSKTTYVLYPG